MCYVHLCIHVCAQYAYVISVHILGLWEQGLGLIFLRYLVCVRGEGEREVLLLLEKLIHMCETNCLMPYGVGLTIKKKKPTQDL